MNIIKIKQFNLLLSLALMMSLASLNVSAASWSGKAKKLFEDDEYEACIKLTEGYRTDNQAAMFLAFSHLQENIFNKTKEDKEKFKAYSARLEAKLGINDIDNLLYFIAMDDKPYVVKEARQLVKGVFKSITDIEQIPKLVDVLKIKDESTRKLALSSIQRILKPKRAYVVKGGTLRAKDIKIMNSQTLIKALLNQMELSQAKAALVLIEEPVLKYVGDYTSVTAVKLENSINKKIEGRKKKYPKSNWYSATGKKR